MNLKHLTIGILAVVFAPITLGLVLLSVIIVNLEFAGALLVEIWERFWESNK